MRNFAVETAKKIMINEVKIDELLALYPELKEDVLKEIEEMKKLQPSNLITAILNKYTAESKLAQKKITGSNFNSKTVNTFLPSIIKARFAFYLLENVNKTIAAGSGNNRIRFNLWDGNILQKLLFKTGLERKPVSLKLFRFAWHFIVNKKIPMLLFNDKGIYCFYTKELISELSKIIGQLECHEIAAGDGTLTKFLNENGTKCKASDDYSWESYISYPDFVEKLGAKTALEKYSPEVAICSWPVPKNTYEKHVFQTKSVMMYIVIGTRNPQITGDFHSYNTIDNFSVELDERLSSLIIPPSRENAVYIFRRK